MSRTRRSIYRRGDTRLFTGLESEIPRGWRIVEESKNRALVGAGNSYDPMQQFGAESVIPVAIVNNHTLSNANLANHNHSLTLRAGIYDRYQGVGKPSDNGGATHTTSTSGAGSNLAHTHGASVSEVDLHQPSLAVFLIKRV